MVFFLRMDQTTPASASAPSVEEEIRILEEEIKKDTNDLTGMRKRVMEIWDQGLSEADKARVENIKKQLGM